MSTVGQILKEARESKFYTIEQVEKATKIRVELLQALESDNYHKLPPPTFVQGFIKNYSKFLGLDTEKLLAIFRREFSDRKHPQKILESWRNPMEKKNFSITPTKVISGLIVTLVLIFFSYLWIEYRFLAGAPFLEITQPEDAVTVQSEVVKVGGKTDPESKVLINNQEVQVDPSGNFSQDIKLQESVNTISVQSTSKTGKTTTEQRTVYLKR